MNVEKVQPIFRWAGGKTKMMKHYRSLIPRNITTYVEPFFGGGAFFCQVDFENAVINDINSELIALFTLLRDDPTSLITDVSILEEEYLCKNKEQRKIFYYDCRQKYWNEQSTALLYFLMKTSFNGIWQTCKASNGMFGTPCGLLDEKKPFIDKDLLMKFSKKLQTVTINNGCFSDIDIPFGSFVFCDPPYRNSFADYSNPFNDEKQNELIEWARYQAKNNGCEVWISNRECDDGFFEKHASDATILKFPVTYTAGRRLNTKTGFEAKKAEEVLIRFNNIVDLGYIPQKNLVEYDN